MKIKRENKQKHWYIIHTCQILKATAVNRALPSLQGGLFKITLTVPSRLEVQAEIISSNKWSNKFLLLKNFIFEEIYLPFLDINTISFYIWRLLKMKEENSCEKDSFKVLVNPVLKNKNEQHGTPVRESQVEPVLSESTRNDGQAGPPDDVDGLVQDVLVPISKMVFLKVIFIDIGITAGI